MGCSRLTSSTHCLAQVSYVAKTQLGRITPLIIPRCTILCWRGTTKSVLPCHKIWEQVIYICHTSLGLTSRLHCLEVMWRLTSTCLNHCLELRTSLLRSEPMLFSPRDKIVLDSIRPTCTRLARGAKTLTSRLTEWIAWRGHFFENKVALGQIGAVDCACLPYGDFANNNRHVICGNFESLMSDPFSGSSTKNSRNIEFNIQF